LAPAIARAGKGGNGKGHGNGSSVTDPSGSMTLSDAAPHFGETITVTADHPIPNGVKYSVGVSVTCKQDGNPVYLYAQFTQDPAPFESQFTLGPS